MNTENKPQVNVVSLASGAAFVIVGILLLLERGGTLEMRQIVSLWPVGLIVLGAAVAWQAARGESRNAAAGSGALVWLIIVGMALTYTFDRKAAGVGGEGYAGGFAVLAADRRPAFTGALRGGKVTSVLGGVDLDLRNASLEPGQTAIIDVFNLLGGTDIKVPENWLVSLETVTVLGGVSDERIRGERDDEDGREDGDQTAEAAIVPSPTMVVPPPATPDAVYATDGRDAPRLVVRGTVILGGLKVRK